MKKYLPLVLFSFFSLVTFAQVEIVAKELTKKELKQLKREKAYEKQKTRY